MTRLETSEAPMRTIQDLPGPPRLPFLGNAHSLRATTFHNVAEAWSEQYGPLYRFNIGSRDVVAVADEQLMGEALRDRPGGYRRWKEIEEISREQRMHGVFFAEGEDWHRQRRLAVTALNSAHLSRYFKVIETASERLHQHLLKRAGGDAFDISAQFSAYAVDVTTSLAFGEDIAELESADRLEQNLRLVFR